MMPSGINGGLRSANPPYEFNAPNGAVYGFAPTPPRSIWRGPIHSPRTAVPGLYLASADAGFGGYTGVVQSAGACADMILREN